MSTTRRISIRRIVCLVFAVAFIIATVYLALTSASINREVREWVDARPMETAIDLSRPGTVVAPFTQTCATSHGLHLWVQLPDDPAGRSAEQLLEGLEGRIIIVDLAGDEVTSAPIEVPSFFHGDVTKPIDITSIETFDIGDYTARIEITAGAAALPEEEQRLFVKYALCGLELMPAAITGVLAIVCGIPALILTLTGGRGLVKYGVYQRPPP